MENKNSKVLLEVKGLKKYFFLNKNFLGKPQMTLRAVDDISFKLEAGKTIGVVGESGCGKTTLGRTILQLYDTTGGKSLYYGHLVDEFLPDYYVKGVNQLNGYANQIVNAIDKIKNSNIFDLIKDVFVIDENHTLIDYYESIEKINALVSSLDKPMEEQKQINKQKDKIINNINLIISLYDKAACLVGGAILGDPIQISKIYNRYIAAIKENNELIKNESIKELNEVKAKINKSPLYDDLESRIEKGLDLAKLTKKEIRSLRTEIQLIFQDPYSSLPPRMTIGSILKEPVSVHKIVPKDEISEHIHATMKKCGLQPQYYDRYPHEFSGGQRQRICIARALSVNPKLVICDEPVSALDVSIQAQIINLLKDLQKELGLTYMFISHDLSVVKYITDNIIVMYLGNMMETGNTEDIFKNPLHPYTQALFSAVPNPDPDAKMDRIILKGDIPSPANPPKGCKFHTRCEKCMNVCKFKTPKFINYEDNHVVACHLYDKEVMDNLDKYDEEYKNIQILEQKQKELDEIKEQKKIINVIKNKSKKIINKIKRNEKE